MSGFIFYAAIAALALVNIPWSKVGRVKTLLSGFWKSEKGGDPSLSGWDSDLPPCDETHLWAEAIDEYCPAASDSDKWQYLVDRLSPIQAAKAAQKSGEVDE